MISCRPIMALLCALAASPGCALSHFARGTDDVVPTADHVLVGDATDAPADRISDVPVVSTDAADVVTPEDVPLGVDVQPDLVVGIDVPPAVDVQPDIPPAIDVQPDIPPAIDVRPDIPPAVDVQPDIPPAVDVQPDVPPTTLPPGSACTASGTPACGSGTACDTFNGGSFCADCGAFGQRGCSGACREGTWDSFADVCYRTTGFGTAGGPCVRNSDCGTQCVNGHCIVCGSVGQGCCCSGFSCSCNGGLTCADRSASSPWTVCH